MSSDCEATTYYASTLERTREHSNAVTKNNVIIRILVNIK